MAWLWEGGGPSNGRALPGTVDKVVIFGLPHLTFDDMGTGLTPNLDRLMDEGATAAMTVRSASARPSAAEAYASLGASAQLRGPKPGGRAYEATAPDAGGTAGEALARQTGRPARGDVVVPGGLLVHLFNEGRVAPSDAGALGDALHRAGRRTGVVGNADHVDSPLPDLPATYRPAALAVMDFDFVVDAGAVERSSVLTPDPDAPFGHRADAERVLATAEAAIHDADVVLVDPGDLERAAAYRRLSLPGAGQQMWQEAVQRTDALLGQLLERLPPRSLVIAAAVTQPGGQWHLTPVIVHGPSVQHSWLHSPATKRPGVVTLTDLAPTVLRALGERVPPEMIGEPLRLRAGAPTLERLRDFQELPRLRELIAPPLINGFVAIQALVGVLALLVLRGRSQRAPARILRGAVLAVAAFPLATFLLRALPGHAGLGRTAAVLLLLAIDAAVVMIALRARRHPLSPLMVVTGATAVLLVADVATGGRLQASSVLGYSYLAGARFYGIGNAAFAVLGACALVTATIYVESAQRRSRALAVAGAALLLVVVVDGAPSLGNDAGGILAFVPAAGLLLYALSGRRVSWRVVAVLGVAAALLLAASVALDLLRSPAARTHLGRLASDAGDGDVFATTIARKLRTNVEVLSRTVWVWMAPISGLLALYLLVWKRRWATLLPAGSARRAGFLALLLLALLGFALNDSGMLVAGVALVFVTPYLVLLALHQDAAADVTPSAVPPDAPRDDDPAMPAGATPLLLR